MFKTAPVLAARAQAVITRYQAFVLEDLAPLDNPAFIVRVQELRAIRPTLHDLRAEAQAILADPGASALSPDLRDDLQVLVDEAEIAITDIDVEIDPDTRWKDLDRSKKNELIHGAAIKQDKVVDLVRQMRGKKRNARLGLPEPEDVALPRAANADTGEPIVDRHDTRFFNPDGSPKKPRGFKR